MKLDENISARCDKLTERLRQSNMALQQGLNEASEKEQQLSEIINKQQQDFKLLFDTSNNDWLVENKDQLLELQREFEAVLKMYLTQKQKVSDELYLHKRKKKSINAYNNVLK